MDRRDTILALAALGAAAKSPAILAQSAKLPRRIGTLDDSTESSRTRGWAAFRKRLQELGYVEGAGYVIEARFAKVQADRLPALAAELVALKPEVIVTPSSIAALAAKRATSTIPIVYGGANDPIRTGLITNYARPDGNLTGISIVQQDLTGKWLELLREILPRAKSLAFLMYADNEGAMQMFADLREQAKAFGMTVRAFDGTRSANVQRAFETIARERVDGLMVSASATLINQRRQIVEGAARLRIPAVYARRDYVEAGGLMSYGAAYDAIYPRVADYVHRILQGAKPSELPFERASLIRLVVNAKALKELGLTIPESLRVRVDEVIQ